MASERTQIVEIRAARRTLEKMRDRLLNPSFESLERSAADLNLAAEYLGRLDVTSHAWKGPGRKALEAEVIGLRAEVRCVEALLSNAGKFYAGWARLMSPDQSPPNYNSAGSNRPTAQQESKLVIHA